LTDGRPPLLPTPPANSPHPQQPEVICFRCDRPGHIARFYPDRRPHAYTTENTANQSPTTDVENLNWCLDSGATHHMTANTASLPPAQPYTGTDTIIVGNGNQLAITHIGNTKLTGLDKSLNLNEVLCVPAIRKNLISVCHFCRDNDCFFELDANGFNVKDIKTGTVLLTGNSSDGLYHIQAAPHVAHQFAFYGERTTQDAWHARLGHPSHSVFTTLFYHLPIDGTIISNKNCHICPLGKSCRLRFEHRKLHAQFPLALLHLDLWGPAPVSSNFGYRFYLSIVDDNTRFTWLYPLAKRSDVLPTFITFKKMVENRFSSTIKQLHIDGSGEFTSKLFLAFLSDHGISHQISCPYTP
ncbi:unnamed protein product, partial [Prunus brigantina]